MTAEDQRTPFRIGEWTVNSEANVLIREDIERHVEPKVMKVLLTLALRQGHVYTKEALIAAVWPDTFVSDDALTRCISILRRITEDDPQEPRFIQTVPKVGYRLVAPIREMLPRELAEPVPFQSPELLPKPSVAETELSVLPIPPSAPKPIRTADSHKGVRPWFAIALIFIVLTGAFLGWMHTLTNSRQDRTRFRTVPFTSGAGEQTEPAFSPSGRTIAFVRIAEDGTSRRICLKDLGSESVRELTHDEDLQFSPAWSPDGMRIAYLAKSKAGLGLFIASVAGQAAARRVFIPQEPSHWEQGALSWSPDGKSLIFPDHPGTSPSSSIFRLALDTSRIEPITTPPAGWEGDLNPAYSPDGKQIAFTRASETAVRDIYSMSTETGVLHQLTHDRTSIDSLAWDRTGRSILFSSNRGGKYSLWKIDLGQSAPERLPVGTEDAFQPTVGPKVGELAYTQGTAIWSIERLESKGVSATTETVLSSTQQDSAPSLSPDGQFFAFQSQRSGTQEVWIASTKGEALRQLTFAGGPITGSPSWSHRGDAILFDSRVEGHSHIFRIPVSGGSAQQITFGNTNDIVPRWSTNDEVIYFRSNRGGRWQVWKVSAHGGEAQPVTTGDGIAAEESTDGTLLYYTRGDEPGIWSVPVGGGPEVNVLPEPAAGYWGYFQVTSQGIFYLDLSTSPGSIRLFKPNTKQTLLFADLQRTPPQYQGLSVDGHGKSIFITGERDAGQHITLVAPEP